MVFDFGAHTCRAGFAGEDTPKVLHVATHILYKLHIYFTSYAIPTLSYIVHETVSYVKHVVLNVLSLQLLIYILQIPTRHFSFDQGLFYRQMYYQ